MTKRSSKVWAKTSKNTDSQWHPLILHLLDVAASADAILSREPESTRNRLAEVLGTTWEMARPWLLLLIACHDLGKACPGFQCKWKNLTELDVGKNPDTDINHAFVSQIALAEMLCGKGWPEDLADLVADAVGCHHGSRATPSTINKLSGNRRALGNVDWSDVRNEVFESLFEVLKPTFIPTKSTLTGSDFMLLAGLTSFSDWIGSNENWFPFGTPDDCDDPKAWLVKRREENAERALNQIGWQPRAPLASETKTFEQVFPFPPRPLQQAITEAVINIQAPSILLVEAPMGEGKTEGAFFAHLRLQQQMQHRGLYIALPTKATGNAMFKRTLEFLQNQGIDRQLDLQLLHGGTLLNDDFQKIKVTNIFDEVFGGNVRASEWFTSKKRALLSEYGVGTIDQALLPILPVRHQFVRLWGLANRVVIFDEIHAYDAYTGTLLIHLLRWLLSLGSSIVLLSATLPPAFRRDLARVVGGRIPEHEVKYPRLSVFQQGRTPSQIHFPADSSRTITVQIKGISVELADMRDSLLAQLQNGGMALALVNTVQRAQELYSLFGYGKTIKGTNTSIGKRLDNGMEIYLFHARYPAGLRQVREDNALALFGREGKRAGAKILIATQVAEQSLDLDFDVMASDLAPIDLILQRAGRLWRHRREKRPGTQPVLFIAGLQGDKPDDFGNPLWWSSVYREDILLRSWVLLKTLSAITLPDQIDFLVQDVYEDRVAIPAHLDSRMNHAILEEGEIVAHRQQAHAAIIGLPDDASWNDPARFTLFDEDEPGIHKTLMAKTRLGEDSVITIPIWPQDEFDAGVVPDFQQAKTWFMCAISISRKAIVGRLQKLGRPDGWQESPLLCNCFPLLLNVNGEWIEDVKVRLDSELGLVYETKENV
ncbi:CRISPR-associated helicase Cas3' [Nitrincola iocasae]|uniref:CRISPR-associated helicase Cas3' n=1 Tax=Nitrincola iocasae TaxID=2614693 RepID=UPI001782CBAE|nr:CRISPR-associated helicase Cas3' [Nitrincola iocasae]